jgi:hypothetical protein
MSVIPVILDGGLEFSKSRQEAAPGSLVDCKNFEVANKRGYRHIQGMKSYSGGTASNVVDPYVFHNVDGEYGENITIDVIDFEEGQIIQWGEGGNFNVATQSLTDYDGYAIVCFTSYRDDNILSFCITNVVGRLPAVGDVMVCNGSTITVTGVPKLASEVIRVGGTDVFSNAAFGGSVDYANTADGVSTLIEAFDVHLALFSDSAAPVPCNPLGSIRGGFYFNDIAYCIADIETWNFTSGSAMPSEGDTFLIYYTLTAPTGAFITYTVDKVVTTSGDWSAGTAAGKIMLAMIPVTNDFTFSSVKVPTDCRNNTTAVNNPMTLGVLARSENAALWKETKPTFDAPTDLWARVDLGYELRFIAGDNFFTVLNRANRNAALEAGTPSTSSAGAGTATGNWTNPNNALGTANTSVATDANDSGPGRVLKLTNYGFNLPSTAIVLGVKATVTRRRTVGGVTEGVRDYEIKLVGVNQSQNKKRNELWPTVLTAVDYGGASDLWDASLSASVVNSADFGISIAAEAVNGAGATTRELDAIVLEVTYKDRSSLVYFGDVTTTAITSITRAVSTATVTTTAAHGFTTGQSVTHAGANQAEYNITATITVTGATTYTYTVSGAPATPATGTITAFRNYSTARAIWYYKEKGDWSTNDAQGTLTLYEVSAPTAIKVGQIMRNSSGAGGTTYATVASACEKVRLASSNALDLNKSQWDISEPVNFFGAVGLEQVLMASGADFGGTFDSNYYIRVRTGIEENQDKPRHVVKHLDQALWGYLQGVTIASDLGYPESVAGVVGGTLGGSSPISDDTVTYTFGGGAQQILHGDSVYGYIALSQQSMGVVCRNSIQQLVGSGGSLVSNLISGEAGGLEYTLKQMGIPVFVDYRGIGSLTATAAFGDFARGRLSDAVSDWLLPRLRESGAGSISNIGLIRTEVIRGKNQLRLYFRDRYVLTMTMVGNGFDNPQFTIQVLPFIPACTFTGVTSGGKDLFFLSAYGMAEEGAFTNDLKTPYEADNTIVPNANLYAPNFLFQGDVGMTWDNRLPIDSYIEINGGASGKEWARKKYQFMFVGGQCSGFAPFAANYGVDFGDIETGTPLNINGGSTTGSGIKAFSEQPFSTKADIKRDGFALSVKFVSSGASVYGATSGQTSPYKFRPFTLQSMILITENLQDVRPY